MDATPVNPRDVFKAAVLANASGIIAAHNHPSGDPSPTPDDVAVTRRLVSAGKILRVDVRDHIMIGDARWRSLREVASPRQFTRASRLRGGCANARRQS